MSTTVQGYDYAANLHFDWNKKKQQKRFPLNKRPVVVGQEVFKASPFHLGPWNTVSHRCIPFSLEHFQDQIPPMETEVFTVVEWTTVDLR